jgi:beta-lactamase class A
MLAASLAAGAVLLSPTPSLDDLKARVASLDSRFESLSRSFPGRLGIHLHLLDQDLTAGAREKERFPSASTIKTAVMAEAFRQVEAGELAWDAKVKLWEKPRRHASLWAYYLDEGLSVNIDGLIHLMMSVSDNTATVVLAEKLGAEKIEKTLLGWGLKETAWTSYPPATNQRLVRLRQTFANMGVTTPHEMGTLLAMMGRKKLISPSASEKMIRIMGAQYWDSYIRWSVPPEVMVASKVGALNRSRSDSAIVFGPVPYVLTIYTDAQQDRRWTADNKGLATIRQVSSLVWNTLHPANRYQPPADAMKWLPTGGGVTP